MEGQDQATPREDVSAFTKSSGTHYNILQGKVEFVLLSWTSWKCLVYSSIEAWTVGDKGRIKFCKFSTMLRPEGALLHRICTSMYLEGCFSTQLMRQTTWNPVKTTQDSSLKGNFESKSQQKPNFCFCVSTDMKFPTQVI